MLPEYDESVKWMTIKMQWKLFFILINTLFFESYCQQMSDAKNLLKYMFKDKNYKKKIRPVLNQSEALVLDVSLFLFSVNSVDEVQEKLVTTCYLELVWIDESLVWEPDSFSDVGRIYIPQDDIWKPDLVLKNGFTRFKALGGDFYYVDVDNDGQVTWLPYKVFESRCYIDITYFPFDKQTCNITFTIWSHSIDEVIIELSTKGFQLYEYKENGAWAITSTDIHIGTTLRESQITFTINMRRKSLHFVMNTIIPMIFLGILTTLTFKIPAESGEKISFSMTVFLAFTVFLTIVYQDLPVHSENTPIIGIYLLIQMCYGVVVLVTVSFQLQMCHRPDKHHVSGGYRKFVVLYRKVCVNKHERRYPKIVPLSSKVSVFPDDQGNKDDRFADDCGWKDVSSAIDAFAFWLCLISEILITTIILIVMSQV